jgi:hypothetical protein
MQPDPFFVALGIAIMTTAAVSFVGYLVLQPLLALRWSGRWRIAALVPLVAVVPVAIHAGYGIATGSNLWPLFLFFAMPLAFFYLLILAGVHRCVRRATHS